LKVRLEVDGGGMLDEGGMKDTVSAKPGAACRAGLEEGGKGGVWVGGLRGYAVAEEYSF